MDLSNYAKKFIFSEGWVAPTRLEFEDIIATPLSRNDLTEDLKAVNGSRELIMKTRGGSWPSSEISEDTDLLDLAWHEREFQTGKSFAYVVYDKQGKYTGCFYLYPLGVRTPLSESTKDFDVEASWWVTQEAYDQGYYSKLYQALEKWLPDSFSFTHIYYSNKEMPA